jgi:ubiquinone/menaquinone biosynthesis C-methylase UbiE/uncharacterized protein YbaR (Trm112 family)
VSERPLLDPQLREILCCPACRGELADAADGSELSCAACAFRFPIVDGIPVLFPLDVSAHFERLFGRYWDSEERAETYDRFVEGAESMIDLHHHRGETRATLEVLGDLSGRRILDCGCGNGRFFEHYPPGAFAVGVDASLNLLRICRRKGRCERLVCCELEHLPFVDGAFDRVLSVRVLQHLRQQREAVREMSRVLEPGGELTLHCYNRASSKGLVKKLRESRLGPLLNAPFRAAFRTLSPFGPWPLDYDAYNTAFELRRWMREAGVEPVQVRGTGFSPNKWFLADFLLAPRLERRAPTLFARYLEASLRWEERLGRRRPFSYLMEKFVLRGVKRAR